MSNPETLQNYPDAICQVEFLDSDPRDKRGFDHYSDCASHNEPAYPNGECDCGISLLNEWAITDWKKDKPKKEGIYLWRKRSTDRLYRWEPYNVFDGECWATGSAMQWPKGGWWYGPIVIPK